MRSVFVRTYVTLAAVVLAALAATWAWGATMRHPPDPFRDLALNGPLQVLETFRAAPSDEAAEQALAQRLHTRVTVLPHDTPMPPEARHHVEVGLPAIPLPGGPPTVWVPLPDGRIVRLEPDALPPRPWPWAAAGALLVLGAATAWQLRPLDRALERLGQAAERLAAGDLSVRVDLPRSGPVGELAARFDAMAARLDRLIRGRTDLLLAVSHELRTPLQRIRLATELLVDSRGEEEERRTLADGLERDLDELDGLVAELLDLGRVEAERPVGDRVDLAPIAEEAADGARRLGCEVTVEGGATVTGDADLLRRAVGNLVQNAVRYGNGTVRLTLAREGVLGVVAVEDDGPGVPEDQRDRILEPFVRLDEARDRVTGGAGLGLALVARIVRQHGGELVVGSSSALGGARFELRLPADGR